MIIYFLISSIYQQMDVLVDIKVRVLAYRWDNVRYDCIIYTLDIDFCKCWSFPVVCSGIGCSVKLPKA